MMRSNRSLLPLLLAVVAIVLLNAAGSTLFIRRDLTNNRAYSLSAASKTTVSELKEPLTIKVFFSPNLPAPYNNTEQTLRDLLEEYGIAGNRFFNYEFITVPARSATGETSSEEQEASRYRIFPIQIQNVQQDEVKLVTAFMGMAILHGDMLETIAAVTSTTNLEYQITGLMDDMSKKISALLAMRDDIEIRLILSRNLEAFRDSLRTLPVELGNAVDGLNSEFYGRLDYQHIDPFLDASFDARGHGALPLLLRDEVGGEEEAFASLVISRGERSSTLDIITRGIFGSQIADLPYLEESISGVADSLIGVQQEIGFVSGYGIPPLAGQAPNQAQVASTQTDLANFNAVVSSEYRFRELDLDQEVIPDGLETVVVVSPAEHLSDYALYQLDQFFMAGKTLLFFLDSHSIFVPQQNPNQFGSSQAPVYLPRETGLEELIRHYGLELERGYVMDEQSFVQRQRTVEGGISEATIYYAPIIDQAGLNRELRFLETIPEMVVLNMSPVRAAVAGDERVVELFSSSVEGWITRGEEINLANPFQIQPPADEDQDEVPMAQLLRGRSSSYFAGREIPRPESVEEDSDSASTLDSDALEFATSRIDDGSGTLVVVGGSAMIGSNVVDAAGSTGNSLFLLNLFDALSGREDYAVMRTKGAVFAPLDETTPAVRSFIKTFNVAGLPILVVLSGLGVWLFRNRRKRQIESRFSGQERI